MRRMVWLGLVLLVASVCAVSAGEKIKVGYIVSDMSHE